MTESLTQTSVTSNTQVPQNPRQNSSSPQSNPTKNSSRPKEGSGHPKYKKKFKKKKRSTTGPKKSSSVIPSKGPIFTYISSCCSLPARKPAAATKVFGVNPESGKTKETPKGLGHWRCTGCRKSCKVTRTKATGDTKLLLNGDPKLITKIVNSVVPSGQ
jgi:hypothetical protein